VFGLLLIAGTVLAVTAAVIVTEPGLAGEVVTFGPVATVALLAGRHGGDVGRDGRFRVPSGRDPSRRSDGRLVVYNADVFLHAISVPALGAGVVRLTRVRRCWCS
jgi:hypothetical protein